MFRYKVDTGRNTYEFVLVDCVAQTRALAFDHEKLAMLMNQELQSSDHDNTDNEHITAFALPFRSIQLERNTVCFFWQNKRWRFDKLANTLSKAADDSSEQQLENDNVLTTFCATTDNGPATSLTIVNACKNKTLEVFWVNWEGQLAHYRTLTSGKSYTQSTYCGKKRKKKNENFHWYF